MNADPAPVPRAVVADDDADIRDLVAFKLRQGGFVVETADDGEAALRLARESTPDVALLDVMMPKLTGFDVLRAMHDDPKLAGVPVIMLTARGQEADVERGFELGATDYVVKPFSPRELMSRVQSALHRRR